MGAFMEMSPATTTSSTASGAAADAGFRHWNSPVPYLFVGLSLMLLLIAVALILLACSYKKPSPPSNAEDEGKLDNKRVELQPLDMEPKVVVIMAGDDKPTYLAKPICAAAATSCTCHHSLHEQQLQYDQV